MNKYSACVLSQGRHPARHHFNVNTMCYHTIVLIRKEDFFLGFEGIIEK